MWCERRGCQGDCVASTLSLSAAPYPTGLRNVVPAIRRQSGRSSGVEHDLAKVGVEGSNPFARSSVPSSGPDPRLTFRAEEIVRSTLRFRSRIVVSGSKN